MNVLTPCMHTDKEREGITHMCFCVENLEHTLCTIQNQGYNKFKTKNGEIIYQVFGGSLFKLVASEGTIIEFRDDPHI